MKLISIFYFINFRLVIALNSGFGALNVGLTGIQIRFPNETKQRGWGRTDFPPMPRE